MFSRASYDIQPILSYQQAVEREKEIKPIRGKAIKPIGKRRNTHATIFKDAQENIVCHLYDTDVVTFKPDGDIVVHVNGWVTDSTSRFINEVLRGSFYIFNNQMWCAAKVLGGQDWMNFPLLPYKENVFRRSQGGLVMLDPPTCVVHNINRKGAKAVRQRYADFTKYVNNMFRLRVTERGVIDITLEELKQVFGEAPPEQSLRSWCGVNMPVPLEVVEGKKGYGLELQNFKNLITKQGQEDKTADYYRAFLWLAFSPRDSRLRQNRGIRLVDLIEALEDILFALHPDEVFITTEKFGETIRDRYARFFG